MQLVVLPGAVMWLFLVIGLPVSTASSVSPVQQVISMLGEMQQKGREQLAKETQIFQKYADWVGDTKQEIGFEIKASKDSIEKLNAKIERADSDHTMQKKKASELSDDLKNLREQLATKEQKREHRHDEYQAKAKDFQETLDALSRSIMTVSEEKYDRPQAEAYMQREAASVPGMPSLVALLQSEPKVDAYKATTGELLETLRMLKRKFKEQLDEVQSEELSEANAFELMKVSLQNAVALKQRNKRKARMLASQAEALSAKGSADLARVKTALKKDQELVKEMELTLQEKTGIYEENQKVRKAELETISKAIQVISSPDVTGFVQAPANHVMFLQSSNTKQRHPTRTQAGVAYLQERAKTLSSRTLAAVADKLSMGGSFDHVIKMMQDLLDKLKAERSAEANHKKWCDGEVGKNKEKRDEERSEAETQTANIQQYEAEIETLTEEIATLAAEQKKLIESLKTETAQRAEEKEQNEKTIEDAKSGIAAITKALKVLEEFYSKTGGGELLQVKAATTPAPPRRLGLVARRLPTAVGIDSEDVRSSSASSMIAADDTDDDSEPITEEERGNLIFSQIRASAVPKMKAYGGMNDGSSGVLGMLQVIMSDFRRMESETQAAEKQEQNEFNAWAKEVEADRKAKSNEEEAKNQLKDEIADKLSTAKDDLQSALTELKAAGEYFEKLKPLCITVHVSFEERVAARQKEVEALKEAYDILAKKAV